MAIRQSSLVWCDSLETNGVEEVEEMEEFLQVVLEGRARQQQLVLDVIPIQETEKLQQWRARRERDGAVLFQLWSSTLGLPWTGCS